MHDKVQKVLLGCGGGVSELLNNEKLGVTELVFELNAFKAKIKGAFNRLHCCFGNLLCPRD